MRLGLQRALQIARIEVVVLDGVARAQDVRAARSRGSSARAPAARRTASRWRCRSDRSRGCQAFGLEEDLVAVPVREAMDLVLDRRAVARAHALDDAGDTSASDRVRRG